MKANLTSLFRLGTFCLVAWTAACSDDAPKSSTDTLGSETNWLKSCTEDAECGDPNACVCGICTTTCEDSACPQAGATCVEPGGEAAADACGATAPALCLTECSRDADCESGSRCAGGACTVSDGATAEGTGDGAETSDGSGGSESAETDTEGTSGGESSQTGEGGSSAGEPDTDEPEPSPEVMEPESSVGGAGSGSIGEGEEGASCSTTQDCQTGMVCEGEGCGEGEGTCVSELRPCTADIATYCGCDGVEFTSSGSCPGARFANRGACEGSLSSGGAEDGEACLEARDCASGVCEGQGCGEDSPGVCVPEVRACQRDLRQYCDCDGNTFEASGNCAGQRYASEGPCGAASAGGGQVGESCTTGADCESGLCEGEGCGTPDGVCKDPLEICALSIVYYCGCDGKTFTGGPDCAFNRYESVGACAGTAESCGGYASSCIDTPCCEGFICNGESSSCLPE